MNKKKNQDFIQMDYKLEMSYCPSTAKRSGSLQTEPGDTPDQVRQAQEVLHAFLAGGERVSRPSPRLMNTSHALKSFIESAMERIGATDFDDVGAVWRQMVFRADTDDAPDHVAGYVKGKGIKYQGTTFDATAEYDYYTRDALRELFSRQKSHADTCEPMQPNEG